MFNVLLVTTDKSQWSDFAGSLEETGKIQLNWADSGQAALDAAKEQNTHLVVTAENAGDMAGLQLAARLIQVNAMINCAVASSMSEDDFHEASEGLGIMKQLPLTPSREDAQAIVKKLMQITGMA